MTQDAQILRTLIIGCGNIAGGFDAQRAGDQLPLSHAGAYTRHGGYRLVACVEPVADRRAPFMQRWNVSEGYASIGELATHVGQYDVISICSTTTAHVADVMAAIALKPRLIFCEKPVAPTLAEATQLVEACRAAEIHFAVNYNRRWDPAVLHLAGELAAGHWGSVRAVSAVYNKGILNNGSHMIDLLHLLFGRIELIGTGPARADGFAGDPSVPAQLQTQGGVTIQLACTDARDFSLFELHIMTEKAVLSMENGGMSWRTRTAVESEVFAGYRNLGPEVVRAGRLLEATLAAVTEIHKAVVSGGSLASTGENALQALRVCEAVRECAGNMKQS
jgi:predicted dehydrogenase